MSWFKVFSAVVVANIVSWVIISIIGWFIFFMVLDTFNGSLSERLSTIGKSELPTISVPYSSQPVPTAEERAAQKAWEKRLAADRHRARNEAGQKRSAIASSKKTCDFWTAEYLKDGNPKSQAYKEMACSRYRNLLN
ncbi:hypothetical protein [Marinobacter sp. KMM 10035]|uniref:hypothetical protein n=1 Tax=Marinobacter sp. KMM 10035 TaxID=3134034 RepID=UPI00397DB247